MTSQFRECNIKAPMRHNDRRDCYLWPAGRGRAVPLIYHLQVLSISTERRGEQSCFGTKHW